MFDPTFDAPQVQWTTLAGTYGEFEPPGSKARVAYVQTFASLGEQGTGNTAITRDLLPVRELFEIGELNFDELVQRDLDDYRVASELIPYLVRQSEYVRFFPPILAVVVPYQGKHVEPFYPLRHDDEKERRDQDGSVIPNQTLVESSWGKVMQLQRVRLGSDYASQAQLRFNPDRARLLVIDGQHRAMAMLAIRRSATGDWGDRGKDFKHFYEDVAQDLRRPNLMKELQKVQMPVCLCLFPDLMEGSAGPFNVIQACRRLFLDVNKEAKPPTKARIHLLDDSDLRSVFARQVLAEVRAEGNRQGAQSYSLDLDCFEYDSPETTDDRPRRDLALCTVEMLWNLIHWTTFAPDDYHTSVVRRPSRGKAKPRRERFLAEIGADQAITTNEAETWGYGQLDTELDPERVPTAAHAKLSELFMGVWGEGIVRFFQRLHPFQAHYDAVVDLRLNKQHETGHGALAYRALFDGQGVYWTLENYTQSRKKRRKELESIGQQLPMLKIEDAYKAIQEVWLPEEFFPLRSKHYFQEKGAVEPDDNRVSSTRESFNIFRTQAFQIGVLMAFSHLKAASGLEDPQAFLKAQESWIEAWNETLTRRINGEPRGLWAYDRNQKTDDVDRRGLMATHIGRLQVSEWYWFRYFAFEQMAASSVDFTGRLSVESALAYLRPKYIARFTSAIMKRAEDAGEALAENDAYERAVKRWGNALKYSFGINKKDFEASLKGGPVQDSGEDEDEEQ